MCIQRCCGLCSLTFNIGSITYGAMLGVFLRGIPATRCSDRGNLISMPSGSLTYTTLLTLIETGDLALGWTWLIVIDTAWNCGLRCLWHKKAPRSE
jgi:SSS family solute:Na+ symporter